MAESGQPPPPAGRLRGRRAPGIARGAAARTIGAAARTIGAGARARRATVRARLVTTQVVLTAMALAFSGTVAYLLALERTDARLDKSLRQDAQELHALAATGTNPVSGESFASAEDVVVAAIQLKVLAQDEGVLGLRRGKDPLITRQSAPLRPESDPELLRALTPMLDGDTRLRTIRTKVTDYRVLVAPVAPVAPVATAANATSAAPTAGKPAAAFVLVVDSRAEHAETARGFRTFALVAVVAVALIGFVGWIAAGRLLRPIRDIARAATATGGADLSARIPVSGDTDLSDLSRACNAMLDRLEDAFESQRRLLDDVGHELRTPLTIVRGHLEIVDLSDPEDIRATRTLAMTELDRMNRLVDDLTTLATSSRPDFIRPVATDIGRLTDDILDKARTLGDRTWRMPHRADVVALVDPQRVTQACLQLIANAVKFSHPGSVIDIGSRTDADGWAQMWVGDEGVGIEADFLGRVFDRFERGKSAAARDGAGLGLSIVRAIAVGHGGRVEVDSEPGRGSTFTLRLPPAATETGRAFPPAAEPTGG